MLWDLLIDLLLPNGSGRSVERALKRADRGTLAADVRAPAALKRRLNESGWLADEVLAAGIVRQGKAPSLIAMITGLALIQLLRPRPLKSLPREFVLAVTGDQVVAFAMSKWKEGDGTIDLVVKVKHAAVGSWTRSAVRFIDLQAGLSPGGTLDLGDAEPIPVNWDGDPNTAELAELLHG